MDPKTIRAIWLWIAEGLSQPLAAERVGRSGSWLCERIEDFVLMEAKGGDPWLISNLSKVSTFYNTMAYIHAGSAGRLPPWNRKRLLREYMVRKYGGGGPSPELGLMPLPPPRPRPRPLDMGGPRDVWMSYGVPADPRLDNFYPASPDGINSTWNGR